MNYLLILRPEKAVETGKGIWRIGFALGISCFDGKYDASRRIYSIVCYLISDLYTYITYRKFYFQHHIQSYTAHPKLVSPIHLFQ
jgi:hypothetical protein